jgi:hypothetical protein
MEDADRTNYEEQHPKHEFEDERIDRARRRLAETLRTIDELEARMARNAGRSTGQGGS